MTIEAPNLDDRSFLELLREADQIIAQKAPGWTDVTPSDPGRVLLELFAHLTELMIYRLNRLPDKAYRQFLRLIGVRLHPPAAAQTTLRFSRSAAGPAVEIRRGTRVTAARAAGGAEAPVFITADSATIPADGTQVDVLGLHCEAVEGELAGSGTGLPGLSLSVKRPPMIASTGDDLDLMVAVETQPGEAAERARVITFNGKNYRVWHEVENFTNLGPDLDVYTADRLEGTVTFAPAVLEYGPESKPGDAPKALASIPPAGREIRIWYRRGGGPAGNLPAGTLTTLKDPIAGVQVVNPAAATGGQAPETLENALIRGPRDLHSLNRAVTARDFESVAERTVARGRAFTRAALWQYAAPGTVEVLLVPHVPPEQEARVTAASLQAYQTQEARGQIQAALDERRPLGTACVVDWAHYKTVRVKARLGVRGAEDIQTLRQRVMDRLYQTITPLRTRQNPTGWGFGQALRVSDIYYLAQLEPSVRWVDHVSLLVEEVPDKAVRSIAADSFQPQTWYAGSQSTLFRSMDNGAGWEPVARFPNETIDLVRSHGQRPGWVGVSTRVGDAGSHLFLSKDCGETWAEIARPAFHVNDMAWTPQEDQPVLLMATDVGLYQLELHRPDASPLQVLVDPANQNRGFYAVAAARSARGDLNVALATQGVSGVFLSRDAGKSRSFKGIGLVGEDIRVLAIQSAGVQSKLWAGVFVEGGTDPGKGCFSWDLSTGEDPAEGWQQHSKGWDAGSCRAVAFQGTRVLAASHHGGVLRLDGGSAEAAWESPGVNANLPARTLGKFHPLNAVAADPGTVVMAAVEPVRDDASRNQPPALEGVFCSKDGLRYEYCSRKEFTDEVTLPQTFLFCSGEHELEVVSADEPR
jgi:hypothetical protein